MRSVLSGRLALCLSVVGLTLTLWMIARAQGGGAQIPNWLNYQGRLTNANGAPLPDGQYQAVFKLFDAQTNGTQKWSESAQVVAVKGVFSTTLGRGTPFPANLFGQRLWLEVRVEGRTLAPRQELAAVAYAFMAQSALSMPPGALTTGMIADGAVTDPKLAPGTAVPIGGIMAWYGNSSSPPVGWKVCDGSTINDAASPLNGQVTPNLVNHFARGAVGNIIGNLQYGGADTQTLTVQQLPSHSHGVSDPGHSHSVRFSAAASGGSLVSAGDPAGPAAHPTSGSVTGITIQPTGGGQPVSIVPSYVSVIFIMRIM